MNDPRLTPLVAALPATVPFVGPEAIERRRGAPFRARLGANESVFGPSPAAVEAMQRAARDVWMYADPEAHDLRAAIAAHHGVDPAHVMVGEGIDGLLGLLVRLTVTDGTPVVTSDGAYPTFNYHVAGFGGTLHRVPYRDDAEDLSALLSRAAEVGARLVYLANPDNPMGSWHTGAAIEAALDAVPDGALLLLDEAYVDLAPDGTAPTIDPADPRVIRLRTFSKGHGMAGARVGYAIGAAPLIAAFDRVRNHFGMSRMAQAGALASLGDPGWLAHVRAEVAAARTRLPPSVRVAGLSRCRRPRTS
jgi:histidinol-phosphate aminotransferase